MGESGRLIQIDTKKIKTPAPKWAGVFLWTPLNLEKCHDSVDLSFYDAINLRIGQKRRRYCHRERDQHLDMLPPDHSTVFSRYSLLFPG